MEWQFLLGLSAITLIVTGLVIYFGMKLNKAVLKKAPEIAMPLNLTLTGTILMACVVGFWILCLVVRNLRPDSTLGAFVGTTDGLAGALLVSILFAAGAAAILQKVGYPIATRGE